MNYYLYVIGYESAGVVKAEDIQNASHKVFMSTGEHPTTVEQIDQLDFDGYDVAQLIEN